jgi:hypothetical protein
VDENGIPVNQKNKKEAVLRKTGSGFLLEH